MTIPACSAGRWPIWEGCRRLADYTTLPKVKDRLTDLQGDTTYDAPLGDLISQISAEIDRLTGSYFSQSAGLVRLFDGTGTRSLILPKPGFNAVTQLRIMVGGEGGTWTVVSSSDYYLEPAERRSGHPAEWLTLSAVSNVVSRFDAGKRTVEVTGDEGWATTPIEIQDVAINEVIQAWRERGGTREQGPDGFGSAGGRWLFSRRSLDILADYGYGWVRFA